MIADWSGDCYSAWRGDAFQARGDIDTIAKDVFPLHNHVAHVNADAKFKAVIFRDAGVSFTDATLHLGGARDRVHDTGKFHQHSVAG